jgi:hypothetical protein
MADTNKVNDVLGSFRDWARPWEYIGASLARQGLQGAEIELINEIWAEATEAKYWVEPSFQISDELINERLRTTYPWLSTGAIDALIRGASYVWK